MDDITVHIKEDSRGFQRKKMSYASFMLKVELELVLELARSVVLILDSGSGSIYCSSLSGFKSFTSYDRGAKEVSRVKFFSPSGSWLPLACM